MLSQNRASVLGFVFTSLMVTIQIRRRKTTTTTSTSKDMLGNITTDHRTKKKNVQNQREKYFMKCVSISYANSNDGGLMMMQGIGSRLIDETGRSFLDTRNNVCHVGHCHPKVVKAVSRQLATLNTNTRYLHPNVCELAERLIAKCPKPLEKVVFVNSGSVR
jgi:4-aminobutyrate aminotransferase-like enzyme